MLACMSRDLWARLLSSGFNTYGNGYAGVVCFHLGCGVGTHSVSFRVVDSCKDKGSVWGQCDDTDAEYIAE